MKPLFAPVLALVLVACSSDDSSGGAAAPAAGSGSCTMKDGTCFLVSDPASYNLRSECELVGHSWSASACPSSGFARKCTQKTTVTVDQGPKQEVTYVYFFPADSKLACLGTEEKL